MSGKAAKTTLTEQTEEILRQLTNSRNVSRTIAKRAEIILLAFGGLTNQVIARTVALSPKTVGLWRRRWRDSFAALLHMQFRESRAAFRRAVIECLQDAPRLGSPGRFTCEQIVGLIGIACERPEGCGRPVTTWTGRELADEARKRGLVDSISASHVNRILREVDLKPHRSQYWCHTTETDPVRFQQQVEVVCQAYLDAPRLYHEFNTHTVCVDEMTSLQAKQRKVELKPSQPGTIAKEEFEYTRHGTVCVTSNWEVVEGRLVATTISETRGNEDFAEHVKRTIATDPQANWVFVLDNLNTHCGAPLVRAVAEQLGVAPETLGTTGKEGVLKSMATRREFLSHPSHRVRFVYLPKHSSWLNQIEIIFGIIKRRVIRLGSFSSRQDLIGKLHRFIDYFNQTMAKPMNWTYTGRPTRNQPTERPKTWRELRQTERPGRQLALVGANL